MAEQKRRKRDELLPCICYFPRDGKELRYEDVKPEERDQKYIRFEEMTEEQKAAHKKRREETVGRVLSQYYTEHPEEYAKFCQSDMVREYDRKHGFI